MMWYFDSLSDFLNMGGHGFFVWLAYGVSTLTFFGYWLLYRRRKTVLIKQLRRKISSRNHASTT